MLEEFKANNMMLVMIVLLFMSYDETGSKILESVAEELLAKGLL